MQKLKPGDSVAAVSLSWGGAAEFPERYAMGIQELERSFGLNVVPMPNALKSASWIDANPEARAQDLNQAFADDKIKAIFSTIGGDDCIRILPFLDEQLIASHPKIFMGYSDTTVIHLALNKLGLNTYYGPAIMAGFAEAGGMFPYTKAAVKKALFEDIRGPIESPQSYWVNAHPDFSQNKERPRHDSLPRVALQGDAKASGRLLGGCFEVLEFCRGTPVWPEFEKWNGSILFIEIAEGDTTTSPERVSWFLRSLGCSGELQSISGLLFGRPGQIVPVERYEAYEQAIIRVLNEYNLQHIPVISRVEFGHTDPMCVLPYGALTDVDPLTSEITIVETY